MKLAKQFHKLYKAQKPTTHETFHQIVSLPLTCPDCDKTFNNLLPFHIAMQWKASPHLSSIVCEDCYDRMLNPSDQKTTNISDAIDEFLNF